ncbi:MAG TPA: hypothetical protein VIU44_15475 [Gaiellaceae bacterium]
MPSNAKSTDQVRKEIDAEREQLAHAVEQLRTELHEAADVASKLPKLPVLAAGALTGGFVLAGGIGATARLLFRRGREGRTRAKVGRFKVVARD